ncbi:MAG: Gmad2 immunoglobulin-like domain-containing protein [Acidimicrobiia bacterium]|jgi:hypothetical protein
MRRTRTIVTAVLGGSVLTACIATGSPATTSTSSVATTTSSVVASTLPPVVECPGTGEFEEGRGIADIAAGDTGGSNLGRISWETSDRCESFSFDFETSEGAPATSVPAVRIDHLDTFQVIRVYMDIEAAIVTDQLVETPLVDRLYVVRALDGGMFIDLHLNEPAGARARVESSPARLVIDLRPGFVPFTGVSTVDERVVVVSPTRDDNVGRSSVLHGYSRTFEGNVLIVVSQGGDVVDDTSTTAADYLETWGEFETTLTLPSGPVSVFVGEENPEDGTLRGAVFDLNPG